MPSFFSAWIKSGLWDFWPNFRAVINTIVHYMQLLYLITWVLHTKIPSAGLSSSFDTLSLKMWGWNWHVDETEGNSMAEVTVFIKQQWIQNVYSLTTQLQGKALNQTLHYLWLEKQPWRKFMRNQVSWVPGLDVFEKKLPTENEQNVFLLYFDKKCCTSTSLFCVQFFFL